MIFSHKKLVIFELKPVLKMCNRSKTGLIFFLFSMLTFGVHAQDRDIEQQKAKALMKSNDFIYEGNNLLNEDVIAAEKEYRKAISKAPENAIGEYNLGNALYSSGYLDEAYAKHLEAAKKATNKTDRHRAFHNAGNVLMEQKLCQEAVEMYKQALRNNPSDDESRYNLALAKECAKEQGGGEGEDENKDQQEKEEQEKNEDQKDQGDNEDEQKDEGDKKEENNEGDDKEDDQGKPKDEKDNKDPNKPNDQQQQQKPEPGKLSPQQIKNLLEAMNNQEKKVQEKINAKKAKGVKVKVEKDW